MQNGNAQILIYDLETTNLKADFGTLLCVGYKWLGEDAQVLAITDDKHWQKAPWDDKKLIERFMEVYNQADMVITYFGKGFDQPWLYAKLLKHRLTIPDNIPHVDLFFTVKSNMCISRKSLANVSYYLDLEAKKTPVDGQIWVKAGMGDAESIKYIVDHCYADVDLTEELYLRLRPLMRTHPRIAGYGPCRSCGGHKLTRQGYKMTITKGRRVKIRCTECASWDTRTEAEVGIGLGYDYS